MTYEDNCLDLNYPLEGSSQPSKNKLVPDDIMDIVNKKKFLAYEAVRKSGLTNMWAVETVCELAEKMTETTITSDDVLDIIKNYDKYSSQWLESDK